MARNLLFKDLFVVSLLWEDSTPPEKNSFENAGHHFSRNEYKLESQRLLLQLYFSIILKNTNHIISTTPQTNFKSRKPMPLLIVHSQILKLKICELIPITKKQHKSMPQLWCMIYAISGNTKLHGVPVKETKRRINHDTPLMNSKNTSKGIIVITLHTLKVW